MNNSLAAIQSSLTDVKVEKGRDKYGRGYTDYTAFTRRESDPRFMDQTWRAVVVNLPRTSWERDGMKYLVNTDPRGGDGREVLYFADRALAHRAAINAVETRRLAERVQVIEKTHPSEEIAHSMRREYIDAGYAVSLVGFDASREVYAFDLTVRH